MPEREPDRGPKFVWNFPLIRRFQNGNGLLSLGATLVNNSSSESQDNDVEVSSSTESTDDNSNGSLEDLESSIGELEESSSSVFDQLDKDKVVTITDDGFEPDEVSVDTGETIVWVNESSNKAKVISTNNTRLSSQTLDNGDTYEETLYTNVVIEYENSLEDEPSTGTVKVGDPDQSTDVDRVTFDEEPDMDSIRSMSQAANDKEEDDRGFDV